jgi:hypothetical protein
MERDRIDWWLVIPLVGVYLVPLVLHLLGIAFR